MRNSKPVRLDSRWINKIEDLARQRIKKDVDKKFRTPREMSEMMLNCPSFKEIERELSSIPKKEDLK